MFNVMHTERGRSLFSCELLTAAETEGKQLESQVWSQKFKILEVGLMEERLRVIMSMLK